MSDFSDDGDDNHPPPLQAIHHDAVALGRGRGHGRGAGNNANNSNNSNNSNNNNENGSGASGLGGRGRGRGRGNAPAPANVRRSSLWTMTMSSAAHAAQQETQLMESLFGMPSSSSNSMNPALQDAHASENEGEDGVSLGSRDTSDNSNTDDEADEADEDDRQDRRDRRGRRGQNEEAADANDDVVHLANANVYNRRRNVASRSSQASNSHRRVRARLDPRGRAISSMIFNNAFGFNNVSTSEMHDDRDDHAEHPQEDPQDHHDHHDHAGDMDDFSDDNDAEANTNGQPLADHNDSTEQDVEQSLFRVAGVPCVGCALDPSRLAKVNQFVIENAANKQSDALWRLAEGVYNATVVKPCQRERSAAPIWSWQDIRSHYLEHVVNDKLVRLQTCRELGAMRRILVSQMVAVNDETGAQELDKNILDQYMKVVTTESREHALLTSAENAQLKAGTASNSKYGSSIVPTTNASNDDL